jgi:CRP-like cAMP-binding protein
MEEAGALGKIYQDGEVIIKQGEVGSCMYVIQEGRVEVVLEDGDELVQLAVRREGEFFGEMAIFEHEVRMATVRALGKARVLTVDEKNFLRRVHKDPSLAYHLVQTMSKRIRELSVEVAQLKEQDGLED